MAVVQKYIVGIDIGSKNIKMVKLSKKGKITHYSYADIPEGVIENGKVESVQMLSEALKLARKRLGASCKECALCISNQDIVIRQISIPIMPNENILPSIALELSGFLPIDTQKYIIDYIITDKIETDDEKQYTMTVFAIPKEVVKMYAACIKNAGFKLVYVDIMENSYEKLYKFLDNKSMGNAKIQSNFACLYVDNSRSSVSLYGHSKFFINKIMDNGVSNICMSISEKTGKPVEAVKRILFTNDVLTYGETFIIEKSVIEDYAKDISFEVSRVIDYFKSRVKDENVEAIYFSGGFSHVAGIKEYFEEALGVSVINVSDYLDYFYKNPPKNNTGIDYTNAFAVTLREENT